MKKTQKKTNHITINVTDDDYAIIKTLAMQQRRNIAEFCRLLLADAARDMFINSQANRGEFTEAKFKL